MALPYRSDSAAVDLEVDLAAAMVHLFRTDTAAKDRIPVARDRVPAATEMSRRRRMEVMRKDMVKDRTTAAPTRHSSITFLSSCDSTTFHISHVLSPPFLQCHSPHNLFYFAILIYYSSTEHKYRIFYPIGML